MLIMKHNCQMRTHPCAHRPFNWSVVTGIASTCVFCVMFSPVLPSASDSL